MKRRALSASPRSVRVEGVTPFLWFHDHAEDAARFYVSLIAGSRITDRAPGPDGKLLTVSFELAGQPFIALNGGPYFDLSPAFSIVLRCKGQKEVDRLWKALTRGGEESRCGWLVDRFGLSWQVIPERLLELLQDEDPQRAALAAAAMMKMRRIVVRDLEWAVAGEGPSPKKGTGRGKVPRRGKSRRAPA
jgi:predicted 3-demethylubiquinone-9 3-methyltransferase (glyoxalase superfamily)